MASGPSLPAAGAWRPLRMMSFSAVTRRRDPHALRPRFCGRPAGRPGPPVSPWKPHPSCRRSQRSCRKPRAPWPTRRWQRIHFGRSTTSRPEWSATPRQPKLPSFGCLCSTSVRRLLPCWSAFPRCTATGNISRAGVSGAVATRLRWQHQAGRMRASRPITLFAEGLCVQGCEPRMTFATTTVATALAAMVLRLARDGRGPRHGSRGWRLCPCD
mmetsp:Transcript_83913/g.164316  ORF Transcript_83913/g.164316 Transcript_83913/m.164316 type:complete len:214 (+) Transcript_83913:101-742(+)